MEEKEVVESEELDADVDESVDDAEETFEDEAETEDTEETSAESEPADDSEEEETDPFEGIFDDDEESEEGEGDTEGGSSDEEDTADERDVGAPSPTEAGGAAEDALAKYNALSGKVKETLEKLGYKGEGDLLEMLDRAGAEADGVSSAEYDKRKAFEKRAADDLAAIHAAYPETAKYKSWKDFPHYVEFAHLIDDKKARLNAVQAFSAAHPDIVAAHVATAKRQSNLAGTKNHLTSSVPKGAKDTGINMTRRELDEYRDMFPELSDKQIKELYKSANK